jgi:hypothetical protein
LSSRCSRPVAAAFAVMPFVKALYATGSLGNGEEERGDM